MLHSHLQRKIQLMGIFLFIVMLVASACSQPAGVSDEDGSEALAQQDSQESTEDKQEGKHGPGGSGGMKPGGRMGSADKSGDTKLQAMISEVKAKFTTGEYTDSETGITVPYDIFLPDEYDESKTYPMVVFIGDATTVGTDMEYPITQGWGGVVWASEAEQAKHEAIVLIPVFPETVIDDNNGQNKSDYLEILPNLIRETAEKYHADMDRIYGTGQSMGAMAPTSYSALSRSRFCLEILVMSSMLLTRLAYSHCVSCFAVKAGMPKPPTTPFSSVGVSPNSLFFMFTGAKVRISERKAKFICHFW